jgi:hypothetical protein
MLKFSLQQMNTFEAAAREAFRWRILRFLTAEFPEDLGASPERGILERITQYEAAATKHGLQTEQGLAMFITLSFALNCCADEVPGMSDCLKAEDGTTPDERLEKLVDLLPQK